MSPVARWDESFDVVVVGAGAGGMTAALTASLEGARTLLVENTAQVGGTTARSSGTVWIPNNLHQHRLDPTDDSAAAHAYLDALVGNRADRALRDAFLDAGPEMIAYLHERTDVRFQAYPSSPDYRQELPGAANGGRPLEPLPFDGRVLGARFDDVAWPLPELMLFGGMMVTRGEAVRLLDALRVGRFVPARGAAGDTLPGRPPAVSPRNATGARQRAGREALQEPSRPKGPRLAWRRDDGARDRR